MKRVSLLVTGKTEEVLYVALQRLFPSAEFVPRPSRDGFTSVPLRESPLLRAGQTNVEKLARLLVAEVDPGRKDDEVDLAVLVDDLELCNQAWPERVVEHVRAAVRAHIEAHYADHRARDRAYARVRERCSFHVLAPMVEAYFFREPAALGRAGARQASLFNPASTDVEHFFVNDPAYLAPPDRSPNERLPPWATSDRRQHPKRYVQFLCDPTGAIARAYVETEGGRAALRDLDWNAVLASATHVRFVRSLIHDIAVALGEDAIAARFAGDTHDLTWPPRRDNVLRNI